MRVLISGGSRGIGLAISRFMLEANWNVSTFARSPSSDSERLIAEYGERYDFRRFDLCGSNFTNRFNTVFDSKTEFDVVVLNAATERAELFASASEASLQKCVDVNLMGAMQTAQCCLRRALANQRMCKFLFISSVAAVKGIRGLVVYGATKGALLALSKGIAVEYGSRGIRSNVVIPGYIDAGMANNLPEDLVGRVKRRTPTGVVGTAEAVARLVEFLAGDGSSHINGEEIRIDGGFSIA